MKDRERVVGAFERFRDLDRCGRRLGSSSAFPA
jgi:hypothetical protein